MKLLTRMQNLFYCCDNSDGHEKDNIIYMKLEILKVIAMKL